MSSCEYCEILKNTFSTEHLQTTASLVKVHRIISFRIMSNIAVNCKDKGLTRKELRQRYLHFLSLKLPRLLKVILDGVFQKFVTAGKTNFNVSNKTTSIASNDAIVTSGDIFHALDLKSEILAGISFRKVSVICYKLNRKLL